MDIWKIKSQIKSPYFNMILKISKSSQNDLKSDFVKSSIESLNTLPTTTDNVATAGEQSLCSSMSWGRVTVCGQVGRNLTKVQ
jgi:hypothetical protein